MKLASIDIGTNSTRLLIVDYHDAEFRPLVRKMEITRVGMNLEKTGKISTSSAEKTLKVLSSYQKLIRKEGVNKYKAVGTSAIRQASNSNWFLSYIYKNLGMTVEVIKGKEEAKLSFYGAVRDIDIDQILYRINKFGRLRKLRDTKKQIVRSKNINYQGYKLDKSGSKNEINYRDKSNNRNILVVDIGGGSSEFILGSYNFSPVLAESLNIGCVRLIEKFVNSDLLDVSDLNSMHIFIRSRLNNIVEKIKKNSFLFVVGLGGTMTTLAAIDLKLKEYNREKIHHHLLSLGKIRKIYKSLCNLNLQGRKKVIGLEPGRADIIIGGAAIVLEVMKLLEENIIVVSENDILDGIIYSLVDF